MLLKIINDIADSNGSITLGIGVKDNVIPLYSRPEEAIVSAES